VAPIAWAIGATTTMLALVLATLVPPSAELYAGSLLGVSARVLLDEADQLAHVKLQGLVLGGSVEGVGWFDTQDGSLKVQPSIEKVMQRRACRILGASRADDRLTIDLQLPVFGKRAMVLERVE
tara:strand:- start:62 stop:433 length:372 start_codon:yes stop_codon:yes gene_type:complete